MKPTAKLHELGQSLWLDNITRTMLDDGTLQRYIDELSVTGLTSNPTIFDKAISGGDAYDGQIAEAAPRQVDARRGASSSSWRSPTCSGADRPVRGRSTSAPPASTASARSRSRRCSPTTPQATIEQAAALHAKAERENLFIKIPGTPAGLPAIEETIFAGIPVNVTLLFDAEQYLAAADAYMKGIERRIEAGLDPYVASVASIFMSRWDVAVADEVPGRAARTGSACAIGVRAYVAYRELLDSDRVAAAAERGRPPAAAALGQHRDQGPRRLRHALHRGLASPFTVNTMPEQTLLAFADHGEIGDLVPADGGDCEQVLTEFAEAGIDVDALAARLQEEGKQKFVKSWEDLLELDRRRAPGSRPADEPPQGAELKQLPAWAGARGPLRGDQDAHLRELFADDPERGERLVAEGAGLHLDYSKNRITDETLMLLVELARERGVAERRDAMFAGEHINVTEDRAVLHVALRMPRERSLDRRRRRRGRRGARGARPDGGASPSGSAPASGPATPASRSATSINIGIGGSDLGPVMAYEALRHYSRPRA